LAATLKGHTDMVYAVAFSPDGRHVLTGSFDKTLKLWETATGKEIKTFAGQAGHQQMVLSVAFSPDGRYVASGAADNTAKIWDSPLGVSQRDYVHADAVNAVALSPDGTRLAGAAKDSTVKIWNTADGKQLFNLAGHAGPVLGVAFSANGQLASCGGDKTVRIWNATNGQAIGTLGAHATAVNAVVLAPGANAAFSAGDDGLIKIWNLPPKAPRNLPAHNGAVTSLALAPDGQMIVTGSADKTVRLVNFDNGQAVRQWPAKTAAINTVAVNANKTTVAAGDAEGRVFVWNVADSKLLKEFAAHNGPVTTVAINPQNTQLLTAGKDGAVKIWTLPVPGKKPTPADDKPIKELAAHTGGVTGAAFHNNGTQVLTGGADKTVKVWDANTGKPLQTVGPLADSIGAVAFNRECTQFSAAAGKQVKVWNAADGKELLSLVHPVEASALAFSSDKTKMVTGAADQLVRIWDLATGKELEWFRQGDRIRAVAFHPNNTTVVSSSSDKTTVVNNLAISRVIVAAAAPIRTLTLAPSGGHVLAGSDDKTIKLWNLGNGANERSFAGAEGAVNAIAVSRNNVLLAAGGADKVVRLYTFNDAKPLKQLPVQAVVRALAFNPNSQTLAAACEDKSLPTWNILYQPGQPLPPEFGKLGQTFAHAAAVTDVTFAPDNVTLYSGGQDKAIKTWKLASDVPVKNFGHPAREVDAVAFNPASTVLATGSHDGTVRIWDVAKGQQIREIRAHPMPPQQNAVYCIAWSPDGKQIVSGSLDHSLKLWDANSGAMVREFKAYKEKTFEKGHRDAVFSVAFSPDGKSIVSGGSDYSIKLWNVADGNVAREFINPGLKPDPLAPSRAHPGYVYGVRFTSDGKRLVSAGHAPRLQGYVAVWNVADGKMLYGDVFPLGAINSLAVSPDDRLLALACGPRGRDFQNVDSYLIKMPGIEVPAAAQAAK
jgi:WD40 repeat protein